MNKYVKALVYLWLIISSYGLFKQSIDYIMTDMFNVYQYVANQF